MVPHPSSTERRSSYLLAVEVTVDRFPTSTVDGAAFCVFVVVVVLCSRARDVGRNGGRGETS